MKYFSFIFLLISLSVYAQKPKAKASFVSGKTLYAKHCLACHQPDGEGVPHLNPPLIATSYVTGDKQKLIKWVLQGSVENVPIDGKTYTNNMPAQAYLKDKEIASILTYIRSNFGNKASAISEAEVTSIRAVTK